MRTPRSPLQQHDNDQVKCCRSVQDQVQDQFLPNGAPFQVGPRSALNRTQPIDDPIQLLFVDVDLDLDRFFSAEQIPAIATCSGPGPRPSPRPISSEWGATPGRPTIGAESDSADRRPDPTTLLPWTWTWTSTWTWTWTVFSVRSRFQQSRPALVQVQDQVGDGMMA